MCPETEQEKSEMKNIPYRQLIGSLMYLIVRTRPAITHTVNFLSKFSSTSDKSHWIAIKRFLRYLKSTKSQGVCFYYDPSP